MDMFLILHLTGINSTDNLWSVTITLGNTLFNVLSSTLLRNKITGTGNAAFRCKAFIRSVTHHAVNIQHDTTASQHCMKLPDEE